MIMPHSFMVGTAVAGGEGENTIGFISISIGKRAFKANSEYRYETTSCVDRRLKTKLNSGKIQEAFTDKSELE